MSDAMPGPVKVVAPDPSQGANQRRSPRIQVDIAVQIFAAGMTCCGRGHELGFFGMAVHVPIELAEGQTIRIMFQPPGSRMRFGLFGVIRNRQNFKYGIEFLELRPAERTELERVVAVLSPTIAAS